MEMLQKWIKEQRELLITSVVKLILFNYKFYVKILCEKKTAFSVAGL